MAFPDHDAITITLSPTQIDTVVRAAARGHAPSVSALVVDSLAASRASNGARSNRARSNSSAAPATRMRGYMPADTDDPRLSRSLLRGLSLLTGFGPDGAERGIVELAQELGMSASTAHRYAVTLVELGLLERCPRTRKYRLPDIG
jgi:IclR-like helix-turn-helix domain-containing protein